MLSYLQQAVELLAGVAEFLHSGGKAGEFQRRRLCSPICSEVLFQSNRRGLYFPCGVKDSLKCIGLR